MQAINDIQLNQQKAKNSYMTAFSCMVSVENVSFANNLQKYLIFKNRYEKYICRFKSQR